MKVEGLANYFDSMESEKNLNLLKGYFKGKFDSSLEWYRFTEQVDKFYKTICSKRLYLLMWNEEPLELKTIKMADETIKEINVKDFNNNSYKYYRLLSFKQGSFDCLAIFN